MRRAYSHYCVSALRQSNLSFLRVGVQQIEIIRLRGMKRASLPPSRASTTRHSTNRTFSSGLPTLTWSRAIATTKDRIRLNN